MSGVGWWLSFAGGFVATAVLTSVMTGRVWVKHLGRCGHVSHRLKLRCWRSWTWDTQCWKHNRRCYSVCNGVPQW